MAAKKKKFGRRPDETEYVRWTNRFGKYVKPRTGVFLIGQIISRKTGKLVGYINGKSKSTGKANPQRFTATQRSFWTSPIRKQFDVRKPKLAESEWNIVSTKPIVEQIPVKVTTLIRRAAKMEMSEMVAVSVRLTHKDFNIETYQRVIEASTNVKAIREMLAEAIFSALQSMGLRMSPKLKELSRETADYKTRRARERQRNRRHVQRVKANLVIRGI